jgi:septal ring factor EnvC (AmiA/AmiB activator)
MGETTLEKLQKQLKQAESELDSAKQNLADTKRELQQMENEYRASLTRVYQLRASVIANGGDLGIAE